MSTVTCLYPESVAVLTELGFAYDDEIGSVLTYKCTETDMYLSIVFNYLHDGVKPSVKMLYYEYHGMPDVRVVLDSDFSHEWFMDTLEYLGVDALRRLRLKRLTALLD